MKTLLYLLLLSFLSLQVQAQGGFSKIYRYEGDTNRRSEAIFAVTYDNSSQSLYFATNGAPHSNLGLMFSELYRTDLQGNVLQKKIDSIENGGISFSSVIASKDGNYLYWGGNKYLLNAMPDSTQVILRKTDKHFNTIWERSYYTHTATTANYKTMETDSGQIVQLCWKKTNSGLPYPAVPAEMFLIKTDSSGNQLSVCYPVNWTSWTDGRGLEQTNDGGFMIAGTNNDRGYVLKKDDTCAEEWHQNYGTAVTNSWLLGMAKGQGNNENCFIAGQVSINANLGMGLAAKIDAQGNVVWERYMSVDSFSDAFFSVASGNLGSSIYAGDVYFPDLQAARGWMVKLDKDGNEAWNRVYQIPVPGVPVIFDNYLFTMAPQMLPDGGFVAAGSAFAPHPNGGFTQDGWLLRVDSNGCYTPDCSGLFPLAVKDAKSIVETLKIYPNPTTDVLYLERNTFFPKNTIVALTDNLGRHLRTLVTPAGKTKMEYNINGLAPGIYFLKVTIGDKMQSVKFVIKP